MMKKEEEKEEGGGDEWQQEKDEEEDSAEEEEEDDGKESQARGKREACVREVRCGEGGEEARWSELGKVRAPTGKYHSLH